MGRTDPELADVTVMSAPRYKAVFGDDIKNIRVLTVITYQAYGVTGSSTSEPKR
jgi:hypothetical protein